MGGKIAVAGVASLAVQVAVEGFPLSYAPVREPSWLESGLGGAGVNIASILRHLGDDVALCTVVGSDAIGSFIRDQLSVRGLTGPGVVPGPGSSQSVVLVAPDGRRIVYPYLDKVDTVVYPEPVFAEAVRDVDLAVLTNTSFVRPLVSIAARRGVPIAVDLNVIADMDELRWQPWLEAAKIVFCSHERLSCPPAAWVRQLLGRYSGAAMAVVGCGERGAVLGLRDGRLVHFAAVAPLGVVSTSSAGDALFACFLHHWLSTGDPIGALSRAVVFAGWRVGQRDPSGVLVDEEELAQLWRQYSVRATPGRWRP